MANIEARILFDKPLGADEGGGLRVRVVDDHKFGPTVTIVAVPAERVCIGYLNYNLLNNASAVLRSMLVEAERFRDEEIERRRAPATAKQGGGDAP